MHSTLLSEKCGFNVRCLYKQILYFDSVDTGFIQLDQKAVPRIKYYNKQILSALVKANSKVEGGRITFGLMKVYG